MRTSAGRGASLAFCLKRTKQDLTPSPMANRQPALTELDSVFTLAVFCKLKGIGFKEATRDLKKYLRGSYKKAVRRMGEVEGLKAIS